MAEAAGGPLRSRPWVEQQAPGGLDGVRYRFPKRAVPPPFYAQGAGTSLRVNAHSAVGRPPIGRSVRR
jgi:hypothetical protein